MSERTLGALPAPLPRGYLSSMRISHESPEDRGAVTRDEEGHGDLAALTPESIQRIRDFTARKTLEQAYAFVTGLTRLFDKADPDDADRALLRDLAAVGVGRRDAEQIAGQALSLMDLMADRDRKAEVFHAAVREAGQGERAMYERLSALARVLRARLGGRSTSLSKVGVPPDGVAPERGRPHPGKAIYPATVSK